MFFLAKRYPAYEAPLAGATVAPPAKQYIPEAWAGDGKKFVFEARDGETGYEKWEKTSLKFFEMFKWLYEYMGKSGNNSIAYGAGEERVEHEIDEDKDSSIRDYKGKDLLAQAQAKAAGAQSFRYKNMDGSTVRTEYNGYSGHLQSDPTDPFGFIDCVRNSTVQSLEAEEVSRTAVTDHAHYQRMISIGGSQTGIANKRKDTLVTNSDEAKSVKGLHVSTFESAANFPVSPLISQFQDPSELIPLAHPTDTNFAEEFIMGLWKDNNWGSRYYSNTQTFGEYCGSIASRSEKNVFHDLASQFDGSGATVKYNIYDANGDSVRTGDNAFDTGLSSLLINDIEYDTDLYEFMGGITNSGGKIAWSGSADNVYAYLAGADWNEFMGTGGKLIKARAALKTINFAQKMMNSMLMISSGIFDLVGGWDYGTSNFSTYKSLTNTWKASNREKGIEDSHMNILGYLTSYMHPVTYAMRQMTEATAHTDAAHGGYVYVDENGTSKSFLSLFNEAYNDLRAVLSPSSDPEGTDILAKLDALKNTLVNNNFFHKLYNSYGCYYGNGKQIKMVKDGFDLSENGVSYRDDTNAMFFNYTGPVSTGVWTKQNDGSWKYGTSTLDSASRATADALVGASAPAGTKVITNPFYSRSSTPTWKQWYAVSYQYMNGKSTENIWTMLQINRSQREYARAKAEYKAAKKQTEAMEEAEEQRDKAYADKRRSEMQAANQAAEARQRSRQAELKNMAAKNRKK